MTTLPTAIDSAIANALHLLEGSLTCNYAQATTHEVVLVIGWGADAKTIDAVGAYLVGLRVAAIKQSLAVMAALEDTAEDRAEVVAGVEAIVGADNTALTQDQKEDERNPWIAEGLWHFCMMLASRRAELHPRGEVVALDFPHVAAKDHGLDVVAIYRSATGFGLSLVESKAYRIDPNQAISNAVDFFRKVDAGAHDPRIRQVVAGMRSALPQDLQGAISPSLWKADRTYIPNPHYDLSVTQVWTNTRHSFRGLKAPVLVMPHPIHTFAAFFDSVADAMRRFAASLPSHV